MARPKQSAALAGVRLPGAVRACSLVGSAAAALGWAVGSPVTSWRTLGVGAGSDFDHLLIGVTAIAAWASLAWFCIVIALEVAGEVPGACGRGCAALAARVSPPLFRRLAHAALGIGVLIGPLTAGSAMAAGTSTTTTTPATTGVAISLDRPAGVTAIGVTAAGVTATGVTAVAANSPLDLDRPGNPSLPFLPFLPEALAPPTKSTPAAPAALIAGVPHRDGTNDGYVVRRGDALWDIAARHLGADATAADVAREWPRWYAANRTVIGADPGLIRAGELLQPPSP